jgi:tetratricopeptide (TPR) repeat protein
MRQGQREIALLLVLGALFTFLGGFGAFWRFCTLMASEYYLLQGEQALDPSQAQSALKQSIALNARSARSHLSLARAYYQGRWYAGAIVEGQKAFSLTDDPRQKSEAMATVGLAHVAAQQTTLALDAFKLAIELDSQNLQAQSQLQQLQLKNNLSTPP